MHRQGVLMASWDQLLGRFGRRWQESLVTCTWDGKGGLRVPPWHLALAMGVVALVWEASQGMDPGLDGVQLCTSVLSVAVC